MPQVAHEKLQADEGEDTEAEDSENHHISQLLHRLDQGSHDCLQAWESEAGSPTDILLYGPQGRGWARRRALSLLSPALNRAGDREGDQSQGHSEGGFLGLEDIDHLLQLHPSWLPKARQSPALYFWRGLKLFILHQSSIGNGVS